jgi:hypothetical protein
MDLGRLVPASEVAEDIPYHFKIGRPCPFYNGKVCPPAQWFDYILKGRTLVF